MNTKKGELIAPLNINPKNLRTIARLTEQLEKPKTKS